ncbi:uncharacterized protein [Drosophila suzukii]
METTDMVDDEETGDGDNEDNASGSQFDGIFIGKSELPDEVNQLDNSGDVELETVAASIAKPLTSLKATTPSLATSSTSTPAPARASSSNCPLDGDDAFYLQYLGNKLSKYSSRTKNTVQFQINRILYKADMGHYEESSPACDSDSF